MTERHVLIGAALSLALLMAGLVAVGLHREVRFRLRRWRRGGYI